MGTSRKEEYANQPEEKEAEDGRTKVDNVKEEKELGRRVEAAREEGCPEV